MSASENLILTITENGAGKMSSSHDYPLRGRGGMGVQAMDKAMRGGQIVASFPIELEDQIMLVTSKGQSIRVPVEGISFRSRSAGGVKVFDTSKGEKVVSVAWIADQTAEDADVEDRWRRCPRHFDRRIEKDCFRINCDCSQNNCGAIEALFGNNKAS
jgi:DNA gyrase subunit A